MQSSRLRANNLNFGCIEMGSGPLVLALHGFPDTPYTFRHQMEALAASGYRVVAPFMRGYAPTDAPQDGDYHASVLIQDTLALLEALTTEPAIVIGHDWGAVAACGAAVNAPHRVSHLITLAVPYGGGIRRALLTSPTQQRRSWYIYFFQMPYAEQAAAHNDLALIERLWQDWSPGWNYTRDEIEAVKRIFRQPASLTAALNYYRHSFNLYAPPTPYPEIEARIGQPISVPSLYIHGKQDGCIGVECTEGMETAFHAGLEKHILPGAGHFVHREQPETVNRLILNFLER